MDEKQRKVVKIFCVVLIFVFAVSLRLWNLNQMGRTWDEAFYVDQGHKLIDSIANKNFKDSIWYRDPDPPALAKYIYGFADHFSLGKIISCDREFCSYDFTSARLMSVLFSSLTVALVVLMGWEYVSFFVGITAGIIFAMLPIFLGLSQLVTIESILIFFFTASVYSFTRFLKTFSVKSMVICGVLLGLAIGTKYTNIILVPLFISIYLIWKSLKSKKDKKLFNVKLLFLIPISAATFFVIWPIAWFHLDYILQWERSIRFSAVANHSIPEVFFGRLMPVPIIYYFVYWLITTPFLVLLFFLFGLKKISNEKRWILYSILVWFLWPFAQSFLNMKQHGVRYIIEIYAPLSLIAAIGFNGLLRNFVRIKLLKAIFLFALILYLALILKGITPYYLDYFNVVVGGTREVYISKSFQLGWWGQGIREAALYISKNAKRGSKIGVAISPDTVMPDLKGYNLKRYEKDSIYDYIIVNYYNVLREGFDDSSIKKNYIVSHIVWADGAALATIYRHR